jgi:hypothetical protein
VATDAVNKMTTFNVSLFLNGKPTGAIDGSMSLCYYSAAMHKQGIQNVGGSGGTGGEGGRPGRPGKPGKLGSGGGNGTGHSLRPSLANNLSGIIDAAQQTPTSFKPIKLTLSPLGPATDAAETLNPLGALGELMHEINMVD